MIWMASNFCKRKSLIWSPWYPIVFKPSLSRANLYNSKFDLSQKIVCLAQVLMRFRGTDWRVTMEDNSRRTRWSRAIRSAAARSRRSRRRTWRRSWAMWVRRRDCCWASSDQFVARNRWTPDLSWKQHYTMLKPRAGRSDWRGTETPALSWYDISISSQYNKKPTFFSFLNCFGTI